MQNTHTDTKQFKLHELLKWELDGLDSFMDKEPVSIKRLKFNISENQNKIQEFHNQIEFKKNQIESLLKQSKFDEIFIKDLDQEKFLFVESICEDTMKELSIYF